MSHYQSNGLKDKSRMFHPIAPKCTFFSEAHGMVSKKDHIIGRTPSINEYVKIEIASCILSDYNTLKLEINNEK
jgi:hypothetical protein